MSGRWDRRDHRLIGLHATKRGVRAATSRARSGLIVPDADAAQRQPELVGVEIRNPCPTDAGGALGFDAVGAARGRAIDHVGVPHLVVGIAGARDRDQPPRDPIGEPSVASD